MKSIVLLLFGAASLLVAFDAARAQPAHPPCALVCQPPDKLDPGTCTCVTPSAKPPRPCALVCLGPDQVLDAGQCKCVKR